MLNESLLQPPGTPNGADVIVRRRPWIIPADHRSALVVRNLRFSALHNVKAIHVTSTSTDKPRVNNELPTFASVLVENCLFDGMTQTAGEGRHNDGIKADGSSQVGIATALTIRNCTFRRLGGGIMPIHASDGGIGGWGTVLLEGLRFSECAHPVHIGGRCPVGRLIVRDCPGIQIISDGDVSGVAVVVENSPGAVVFGKPYAATPTPPPPPVDPHAECKAALAAMTAERDALQSQLTRSRVAAAALVDVLRD
jgi:hypothetical protein